MDNQIALLKELEISHVEFRSGDGKGIAEYTFEEAKSVKEKLERNGIRISSLGSLIGKIGILDDSNYCEMERFIESFRLGARFMLDCLCCQIIV